MHICGRERFLPSNWLWARQQVVHCALVGDGWIWALGAVTFLSLPSSEAPGGGELSSGQELQFLLLGDTPKGEGGA